MLCGECFGKGVEPFVWGDGQADTEACPWCSGTGEAQRKAAPALLAVGGFKVMTNWPSVPA